MADVTAWGIGSATARAARARVAKAARILSCLSTDYAE